ncbi:MAG TPA: family 16 glycoside hydrolase, partial [Thermoanaerobaculia bacterium]|nr:family 16 glycoside hydrolase [Thermoanaerobaculia bacterium]
MSRSVSTFVLLSVLLVAGVVPAASQSPTVLLQDDFSSGSLLGWNASPLGLAAGWSACAGTASYDGGGHTQIYRGSSAWTDYTVAAKVRVAAAQDFPGGLRGRLDTATGASYAAWFYPGQGKVKLFRAAAWNIDTTGLALLGEASVGIAANVFHDLSLTFDGSRIQVGWNGTTVIDVTDSGSSALAAGAVAFDVSNKVIEFDDLSVTTGGGAPPLFEDDFASGLAGWTPSPLGLFTNWTGGGGTASYNGGGHTQVYAGEDFWTDYRVEAKVRLANGSNFPGGLRGRVDTATGASYAVWIYPGSGVLRLFRATAWNIDASGLTQLAEVNVGTIAPSVFHTLALELEGDQIRVIWNGTEVIDVTDTGRASGAIALDVSNQPIEFDDVVVTDLVPGGTPTNVGPGGPILVISDPANRFTRYLGEILLAEGLNQYRIADLSVFEAYVNARIAGEQEGADFYSERFRDEFAVAFEAWMALDPL